MFAKLVNFRTVLDPVKNLSYFEILDPWVKGHEKKIAKNVCKTKFLFKITKLHSFLNIKPCQ